MIDTPYQTALDLARRIRFKKLTSLELTTLYLDRLAKHGPTLAAVVTITKDLAIAQAKQFDHELGHGHIRSLLHGVPYGIKDVFSTAGVPTTWGSEVYKDRIIDSDSAVVERLFEAGCPLLGKLALIEFAGGPGYRYANASIIGAARNPWDLQRWAGGSSSGSASAVAAGLVGFSIATETIGSIICPASFCGVTAVRPTAGRVSRNGCMSLAWTMDKVGAMARTANDAAAVLSVISGGPETDLRPEIESRYRVPKSHVSIQGLRLGVVRPNYGVGPSAQPEIQRVFKAAAEVLFEGGVTLHEAILPDLPMEAAAFNIVSCESASALEEITDNQNNLDSVIDPAMRGALVANQAIPATDYMRSLRIRSMAQDCLPDLFSHYDILAAPSMTQVAPQVDANLDEYFVGGDGQISALGNLAGLPAITVPIGFGHGHMPVGMQLVGPPLSEDKLFALAAAYQSVTDWHLSVPPLYSTGV